MSSVPFVATYRLQLSASFGFGQLAEIADYLAALGVSHVYLSPYLQAAQGSTHGYDVVDHARVSLELGGEPARQVMIESLRQNRLGHVIDIVPNHMATTTPGNRLWWDLLENGPSSRYAGYFDVDWRSYDVRLHDKVLLPILGDHYGPTLESGKIRVQRGNDARFSLQVYATHQLPLGPFSVGELLARLAEASENDVLAFIADGFKQLPNPAADELAVVGRRERDKAVLYALLARVLAERPAVADALDTELNSINRHPDRLDELIEQQSYRLAYWGMARHDIDYRRFFDVNSLAALRTEREDVFLETHALPLAWLEAGEVDGLRIDHPDGLRDPHTYLRRLRERAPNAWIVVEKILAPGETLPEAWPAHGTTGYDFLGLVTNLFVDPRGERALTEFYAELTGAPHRDFYELARVKKRLVLDQLFGSELTRLTTIFAGICELHTRFRDFARSELQRALRAVIACFPVYRAYVRDAVFGNPDDRSRIETAVTAALAHDPELDRRLSQLLARILGGEVDGHLERELRARFQQLCATVAAKGVEDTAFYCDTRLLCLNEVGSDPGRFGATVEAFHAHCLQITASHPTTMLASSTHDTKRSEDVRARLALLSEVPGHFIELVRRLRELAAPYRSDSFPDPSFESLIYQTLIGSWPIEETRLCAYLEKAMREAKTFSSWLQPDQNYERAVLSFARALLRDSAIVNELEQFARELALPAHINSLAMLTLKLTAPGIPDIYQGNEGFRYDLTDPDNRRAIDFSALRGKLERARGLDADGVLREADPDVLKLFVTQRLLQLRAAQPTAFGRDADYAPLALSGERSAQAVAYTRASRVVTIVPRLGFAATRGWSDARVTLPGSGYRNCFTDEHIGGGEVSLARLFERFPVCVLYA